MLCRVCCCCFLIIGPLPASLLASSAMTYLDLSNNKFSGDVPPLSNNMKLLNLSMNAVDGSINGAVQHPDVLEAKQQINGAGSSAKTV